MDALPFVDYSIVDVDKYKADTSDWFSPEKLKFVQVFPVVSSRKLPVRAQMNGSRCITTQSVSMVGNFGFKCILLFAADIATSKRFLALVKSSLDSETGFDALLLKKQENTHDFVFNDTRIKNIYIINEDLYHITRKHSLAILLKLNKYDCCIFPNSYFNGNLSLLGLLLGERVWIINTWHETMVALDRSSVSHLDFTESNNKWDQKLKNLIKDARRKLLKAPKLSSIKSEQRSDFGFVSGSPAQTERLYGYLNLLDLINGKRVLEVGSGTGNYAFILSDYCREYIAYDTDESVIKLNKEIFKKDRLQYVSSVKEIKGKFDIVICFEVIEHTDQPLRFFLEIKKHLNKNGILIISTPNYRRFPWKCNTREMKEKHKLLGLNHDEMLSRGVLNAHTQELDEGWFAKPYLHDLKLTGIGYITYWSGIKLIREIFAKNSRDDLGNIWVIIENYKNISEDDFMITSDYINGFSSFSFLVYFRRI